MFYRGGIFIIKRVTVQKSKHRKCKLYWRKKNGDAVGFYKFTFEGEGPYNQKAKPECYFNIYPNDADLITGNPQEIFKQEFVQPQTLGEDYYRPSRSAFRSGTFDF